MKCDVCGSDNLEGAAYCEDCGAKLVVSHAMAGGSSAPPPPPPPPPVQAVEPGPVPVVSTPAVTPSGASLQCPSCGADNPASEAYCVDCGANLGGSAASPPVPVVTPPLVTPVAPLQPVVAVARLTLANGQKTYSLDKEITTMGRRSPADQIEPDIDLTDDDPESYVSRRHAQIHRNDDQYVFEDVGSSNGSFINNTKVTAGVQQVLKDADRVRLGKTEFVFHER
jgi:hypothetical protein